MLAVGVMAVALSLCVFVLNYAFGISCKLFPTTEIAKIDVGNARSISVHADTCWEINRGIYYEARDGEKVVIPLQRMGVRAGTAQYHFKVVFAANQSIVGVYDPTESSLDELFIIINFSTGESWPKDYLSGDQLASLKSKALEFFRQLKKENPELPTPEGLSF